MNLFEIFLIQPLVNGLILFYRVLGGNMGLAIIAFSIFLRLILNPLTAPYLESMKKMRDLAPQLEKLKKKYKTNKIKMAQAQAELYRQKGVNPSSGCLTYLLQIVILITFFNVFTRTLAGANDPTSTFNELLYQPLKFSPGESLNTKFLYVDITKPDVLDFPFLSFSLPGPIVILASLTQFISAKVSTSYTLMQEKISKKTPQKSDDVQTAMQKSMIYTFPLLTLIVGMKFASGLALYWFVFSLIQTYQQIKTQGWGELTPAVEKIKKVL